jgi:hypothetical protein
MNPIEHPAYLALLTQWRKLSDEDRAALQSADAEIGARAVVALMDVQCGGTAPADLLVLNAARTRALADAIDRIAAERKAGAS